MNAMNFENGFTVETVFSEAATYIEIDAEDFAATGAFRYYRYYNTVSHGDVAEVELYAATPVAVETEAPETTAPETTAPETAAPEAPEVVEAPQTFDVVLVTVITAAISGIGYMITKKKSF